MAAPAFLRTGTGRAGLFIALTFGQQSWLRLLNIEHHQVLPGTSASLAPGFETAEAMAETKQSQDYWANP